MREVLIHGSVHDEPLWTSQVMLPASLLASADVAAYQEFLDQSEGDAMLAAAAAGVTLNRGIARLRVEPAGSLTMWFTA